MFNKKYKKGMADAAKAYEAFGKKQEDAINQILEEVRKQGGDFAETIKSLNVNIDGLYDYLQSKEKAQLYTVYTPFDIKDLDKEEQLFLIGALFRLTTDKAPIICALYSAIWISRSLPSVLTLWQSRT